MFNIVAFTLLSVSVLILVMPKLDYFNILVRNTPVWRMKQIYFSFSLFICVVAMLISNTSGECLGFLSFESPYNTGAWTLLAALCFYFFLFYDIELNTWIVSKEKAVFKITDSDIIALTQMFSLRVKENNGNFSPIELFGIALNELKQIEVDSVHFGGLEMHNKGFEGQAFGIFYYTKDERVFNYLEWVVELLS